MHKNLKVLNNTSFKYLKDSHSKIVTTINLIIWEYRVKTTQNFADRPMLKLLTNTTEDIVAAECNICVYQTTRN